MLKNSSTWTMFWFCSSQGCGFSWCNSMSRYQTPMRYRTCFIYHLVICYIAMERSTIFKFGKPSISMGHGLTMAMLNNQMVTRPAGHWSLRKDAELMCFSVGSNHWGIFFIQGWSATVVVYIFCLKIVCLQIVSMLKKLHTLKIIEVYSI